MMILLSLVQIMLKNNWWKTKFTMWIHTWFILTMMMIMLDYMMQNNMNIHRGGVSGKKNLSTQYGMTYGNYSGVGSSGEESSIITLLESMCVEQRECHKEESRRRDAFEASQEEHLIT